MCHLIPSGTGKKKRQANGIKGLLHDVPIQSIITKAESKPTASELNFELGTESAARTESRIPLVDFLAVNSNPFNFIGKGIQRVAPPNEIDGKSVVSKYASIS